MAGYCNPTVGKKEAKIDGNLCKEFSSFLVVHALTSILWELNKVGSLPSSFSYNISGIEFIEPNVTYNDVSRY